MKFQKSSPSSRSVWETIRFLTEMISVDGEGNVTLMVRTGKYGVDISYRLILDEQDIQNLLRKLNTATRSEPEPAESEKGD